MSDKPKIVYCDWCGEYCALDISATRFNKTIFITNGVVEEGELHPQKPLYFCSTSHRRNYFLEP